MQFVRAPDEHVFIPRRHHPSNPSSLPSFPFLSPSADIHLEALNLIEIFLLILPFEWWLPTAQYNQLNDAVMAVIYTPLLLVTSYLERRAAQAVCSNRRRGEADDETTQEWEQGVGGTGVDVELDLEREGWASRVKAAAPDVQNGQAVLEVRKLRDEMKELKALVEKLGGGGERGHGEATRDNK